MCISIHNVTVFMSVKERDCECGLDLRGDTVLGTGRCARGIGRTPLKERQPIAINLLDF